MNWSASRGPGSWWIGFTSDRGWLSVAYLTGTVYLDVWHWRIRWAARDYRPLFSERYGYTKWHTVGRLGVHYAKKRRVAASKETR